MSVTPLLNQCLAATMAWMRANELRLNPDKTEMLLVGVLLTRQWVFNLFWMGLHSP